MDASTIIVMLPDGSLRIHDEPSLTGADVLTSFPDCDLFVSKSNSPKPRGSRSGQLQARHSPPSPAADASSAPMTPHTDLDTPLTGGATYFLVPRLPNRSRTMPATVRPRTSCHPCPAAPSHSGSFALSAGVDHATAEYNLSSTTPRGCRAPGAMASPGGPLTPLTVDLCEYKYEGADSSIEPQVLNHQSFHSGQASQVSRTKASGAFAVAASNPILSELSVLEAEGAALSTKLAVEQEVSPSKGSNVRYDWVVRLA
jgi:hypothetical protein